MHNRRKSQVGKVKVTVPSERSKAGREDGSGNGFNAISRDEDAVDGRFPWPFPLNLVARGDGTTARPLCAK